MENKSVLVTGGGGGFGKACARLLLQDGAAVTLTGRSLATLEKARDLLIEAVPDGKIALAAGDSTVEADVRAAIDATIAHGGSIDTVIATVGGGVGYGPVLERSLNEFMGDLLVNLGSAFLAVKLAVPLMKPGSTFVFISSQAATMPFSGLASYCSAKAGLDHFMRSIANELGSKGIRFNSVRPGLTETDGLEAAFKRPGFVESFLPRIPLGRTGKPVDVANAIHFLAGPDSSWITGQSFAVDGGNELRGAPA
jgi:NAD(P)-dependent dehydrogenase (short-subunit alcohol dehydrogenase family)